MGRGILVAGTARSGTSALAGALRTCGVELGTGHLPANEHNPRGYYELQEVLDLHNRFLEAGHTAWDGLNLLPPGWRFGEAARRARAEIRRVFTREFAGKDFWAVKDSRLCRLAPLWVDELRGEELKAIVPLRHPFEVAHSLARFNGKSWTGGLVYWLFNLFETERATRGLPRVHATYAELLADPIGLMGRVEKRLGVSFPCPPAERAAQLRGWIEPGLRRFKQPPPSAHEPGMEPLQAMAEAVYDQFLCDEVWENPARADGLFEQCFGTMFLSYMAVTQQRVAELKRENDVLRTRMKSAEAWMKGSWAQRVFHRWHDPAHPRAARGFWPRLEQSIQRRMGSLDGGGGGGGAGSCETRTPVLSR